MLEINLEELKSETVKKYGEFAQQVEDLLKQYENADAERLGLVASKMGFKKTDIGWMKSSEETSEVNWDIGINLKRREGEIETIPISLLLAYEYCLAAEKITGKKVKFEDMMDKLFSGVQKFRIGNPVPGDADECLYGKALNDESAIPVTSKLYRMVMHAGAQHLDYFKNGQLTGAVFIYEKGIIEEFAEDEKGKPVPMELDGIDFSDISHGQSLLTNFRQLAFHEWTHNAEKEIINPTQEESIDYEYPAVDGNTYRNYEKVETYVQFEKREQESETKLPNIMMTAEGKFKEPRYLISSEKDEYGNSKMFYIVKKEGEEKEERRPLRELRFGLRTGELDESYCVSTGMTTIEIVYDEDGNVKDEIIHNICTEGWVEDIARRMIRAINPDVKDIDEEKYPEYLSMADQIIISRGEEQTIADFLMHSSVLKKELERKSIIKEDGSQVDGLHYMSDYADKVQRGETERIIFYKTYIEELSDENQKFLSSLFKKGNFSNEDIHTISSIVNMDANEVVELIKTYSDIKRKEQAFFDGIPEKLGYRTRDEITQSSDTELAEQRKKSYLGQKKINLEEILEASQQVSLDRKTFEGHDGH